MKQSIALLALIFLFGGTSVAQDKSVPQVKREREFRIKRSQFPKNAADFLEEKLKDAKKIRFYKEIDSNRASYEVKFKKDKLKYSVEFSEKGELEDIEILINEIDIPNESLSQIKGYLSQNFKKFRIRKIQQQYVASPSESPETTLKNAFQNLLLPSINYEFIVSGKQQEEYQDYEILFDASGKFLKLRKSLPANYDHVLY